MDANTRWLAGVLFQDLFSATASCSLFLVAC